jgi:hypothetical protein
MQKKIFEHEPELDKTNEELTIELLKTLNANIVELVKVSKDIDYKLWAYAKQDGIIK